MKKQIWKWIAVVLAVVSLICIITPKIKKEKYNGVTFYVASTSDISGMFRQGADSFSKKYGCTVEFTDDFENCDLIYSSGEDFSLCQPIEKYINKRSKLYTKQIMKNSCSCDGHIYGITNAVLGNINYCTYDCDQLCGTTIPYDLYKSGDWTWNSFIEMGNAINSNIAIDWTKSYINMQRALLLSKDGTPFFDYGTQEQIEWLNFVRTLIYDEGVADNSEGAFKVGFLPEMILDKAEDEGCFRYIPWPTKNGKLSDIFVDEYHFCVPKAAKNVKKSVELANKMIETCVNTRMSLYRENMQEEDFKIFKKQLKKVYSYPKHEDYVPSKIFIEDFIRGKTVTEHIYNVENDVQSAY